MKRNTFIRFVSCMLAAFSVLSLTACELLDMSISESLPLESVSDNGQSTDDSSITSQEGEKDSVVGEDGSDGENAEEPEIKPENPDPEKTVEREITDAIGHKVVYYTDGTYEDLGRVVPLNWDSPDPTTQYGYQSLAKEKDGKGLCAFYEELYEIASDFHASSRDLRVENDTFVDEETGDEYSYSYALLADVNYKNHGISEEQATAVWKVFGDENPIFYWMSMYFFVGDGTLSMCVDSAYAKGFVRKTNIEAIYEMALECDSYLSGLTTETERALTIYDFLLEKIDYAYEKDGVTVVEESWAYNIAGGATTGYGVCECYAETYMYFCELFGIECLNVVGIAGEADDITQEYWGGHAWNYLCLDEKWYAVDITWADVGAFDRWYFGMPLEDYNATHTLDLPTADWGVLYQCAMPTLSGELAPVLFNEEGEEKQMLGSVEEALAKMTDEGGRYEITFYPDTTVTAKSKQSIIAYGDVVAVTKLPKVGHITFIGSTQVDPEYGDTYEAQMGALGEITLQCDITLKEMGFYLDSEEDWVDPWILNGYKVS